MPKPILTPIADRFWPKVKKTDSCWLWTGHRGKFGHGTIGRGRRGEGHILVHRLAWELASGAPAPPTVLHTCDVPNCVRNDEQGTYELDGVLLPRWGHLFDGTRTQNQRDMQLKGRARKGARHQNARVTEQQVCEIRQRFAQRKLVKSRTTWGDPNSITSIARDYGISYVTVFDIVHRKTWAHID